MNITDKNTLKSWFLRGMKPLESQFAAWIDAYWHKSEQIPTSSIDGLEATLNSKAETTVVNNLTTEFNTHRDDDTHHKTSSEIRAEITENDIPDTIARVSETNTKIQTHDTSGEAHQDIRKAITDIKNGDVPVKNSEYAKHLGTEGDSYTKAQLDSKINRHIKEVSYDQTTARFTFTFEDGAVAEVDTPVENTVKDARYDTVAGELVLVLVSGGEIRIAAAGMIKTYSGTASATATVAVNAEGVISADLKEGGVDVVHLSEALRDALNGYQTKTGDTKDNVTVFAEAAERENIQTGENHGVLFGKIRKWFSSLGGLAFRDSVEPLNINYENGDTVIYRGTETLTVSVPGSGARKIVLKGTGLNRYGFYQLRAGERLYLAIDVIGIPVSESSRAFFQRVRLEGGVWTPTNNTTYMYPFVKERGSVTPSDDGFWRWIVEYVDPVTLENQLLSSDIFKMQYVVPGEKILVATDPMSFYKGYITSELGNISCCFEAVGFSEAATVKLQERNMEGAWVDGYADFLILDGVRCVQVDLNVGEYQVVVTESDGKAYSSGSFRVNNPSSCVYQVYVVTEYPQDLTEYPDGTVFIKK